VDRGPDRDVTERQIVARLDVGALACFNLAALTKTFRSDDVSLLTIGEVKSINRYACLCPPPMCRVVILPELFRPPVLGFGTTSDFSGVDRVSSTKSATLLPRRPGVVGLYLRIPM